MIILNNKEIIKLIHILKNTYPEAKCSLDFSNPLELVIAVMLSAQCTDERVNKTTPILFDRCKTIYDFATIDLTSLEQIIHPCGFYKNKAKNIKLCANQVLEKHNGIVPNTMDDLINLAGIGRKSANVVLNDAFNTPIGIAVDTHVKRISRLIGLSNEVIPEKIEKDLLKLFPIEYLSDINHLLVWHGRYTCIARKPKCDNCTIKKYCSYFANIQK